jgi:hypothetical protein
MKPRPGTFDLLRPGVFIARQAADHGARTLIQRIDHRREAQTATKKE